MLNGGGDGGGTAMISKGLSIYYVSGGGGWVFPIFWQSLTEVGWWFSVCWCLLMEVWRRGNIDLSDKTGTFFFFSSQATSCRSGYIRQESNILLMLPYLWLFDSQKSIFYTSIQNYNLKTLQVVFGLVVSLRVGATITCSGNNFEFQHDFLFWLHAYKNVFFSQANLPVDQI